MSKITKMMLLANQSKTNNRGYGQPHERYYRDYDRGHSPDSQRDYAHMDDYRHNADRYDGYPMHDSMAPYSRPHRMSGYNRYDDPETYEDRERPRRMKRRERYDDWDDDDDERESKSRKKQRHPDSDDWGEDYSEHIGESKAREWVMKMRGADGSQGAHFAPEAAEQLRVSHCPDCDRWDFYATVNMLYSDYSHALKKLGMDKPEVYACLSKAFLCDDDAKPGKLARYMKCIPK